MVNIKVRPYIFNYMANPADGEFQWKIKSFSSFFESKVCGSISIVVMIPPAGPLVWTQAETFNEGSSFKDAGDICKSPLTIIIAKINTLRFIEPLP